MFLTEEEPAVAEENDIDWPYNNVLEPENSYSSSESQVDNNEKPEKVRKEKGKPPTTQQFRRVD